MIIKDWLLQATSELKKSGITSARLDAEIILAFSMRKDRTWLHAHSQDEIDSKVRDIADARLKMRSERTPIAYITGEKEFYGRNFKVTSATLIPRPDSEANIELLKNIPIQPGMLLADVGTGSGCLGITAKLEYPNLDVSLLDISPFALNIARENAEKLKADVAISESNLLSNYPFKADIVLANLPYLDENWVRDPETNFEPTKALIAEDNGLSLIKKLLDSTPIKLNYNGYIIIEADRRQHDVIKNYAKEFNLKSIDSLSLSLLFQRL